MRLVLDTNILISALLSPHGTPAMLLSAWQENPSLTLLSTETQLEELMRVMRYPKIRERLEAKYASALAADIRQLATMVHPLPKVTASPDPNDNYLLALAQAGKADYLVTGDKRDLLSLKTFKAAHIITARTALSRIQGD